VLFLGAVPWEISENFDWWVSLLIQWQWPVRQRTKLASVRAVSQVVSLLSSSRLWRLLSRLHLFRRALKLLKNRKLRRLLYLCWAVGPFSTIGTILPLLPISTTCYNAYLSSYRVSKYFHLEEQRRKAYIFTTATTTQLKTTAMMTIPIAGQQQ